MCQVESAARLVDMRAQVHRVPVHLVEQPPQSSAVGRAPQYIGLIPTITSHCTLPACMSASTVLRVRTLLATAARFTVGPYTAPYLPTAPRRGVQLRRPPRAPTAGACSPWNHHRIGHVFFFRSFSRALINASVSPASARPARPVPAASAVAKRNSISLGFRPQADARPSCQ